MSKKSAETVELPPGKQVITLPWSIRPCVDKWNFPCCSGRHCPCFKAVKGRFICEEWHEEWDGEVLSASVMEPCWPAITFVTDRVVFCDPDLNQIPYSRTLGLDKEGLWGEEVGTSKGEVSTANWFMRRLEEVFTSTYDEGVRLTISRLARDASEMIERKVIARHGGPSCKELEVEKPKWAPRKMGLDLPQETVAAHARAIESAGKVSMASWALAELGNIHKNVGSDQFREYVEHLAREMVSRVNLGIEAVYGDRSVRTIEVPEWAKETKE